MQILKNLERCPVMWLDEVKHGERTKKASNSIYHQYHAAGGIQGLKLLYTEDYAPGTAALRGRGGKGTWNHCA